MRRILNNNVAATQQCKSASCLYRYSVLIFTLLFSMLTHANLDSDGDGLNDNIDPFPNDTTNKANANWAFCVNEFSLCKLPVPALVRYGDGDTYYYQQATDEIWCDNSIFGNPINTSKRCDYLLSDTLDFDNDGVVDNVDVFPADHTETHDTDGDGFGDNADPFPTDPQNQANANWVFCVNEFNLCKLPAPALVRYGDGDTYYYQQATDEIWCNNSVFGNPINVRKRCDYLLSDTLDFDNDGVVDSADAFPADPLENHDSDADGFGDNTDPFPNDATNKANANWAFCSGEFGICTPPAPALVRYGLNGQYFYQQVTGSIDCKNSAFGDPINLRKQCDYLLSDSIDYDNDGVVDNLDAFPSDPSETLDSDGDGLGDNADHFPNDATNALNADWIYCVSEGYTCSPPVPALVRYGVAEFDEYVFQHVDDSILCRNAVFGFRTGGQYYRRCGYLLSDTTDYDNDGVVDSADIFPADPLEHQDTDGDGFGDNSDLFPNDASNNPSGTWVRCSEEFGICRLPMTTAVRYGVEGQYFYQRTSGNIECKNHVFGNPADARKHCDYFLSDSEDTDGDGVVDNVDTFPGNANESQDTDGDGVGDNADPYPNDSANAPDNANWQYCSDEWGACEVPVPSTVRYGANGVYFFQHVSESTACTNAVFGDPIGNVLKQCAYLLSETADFDQDGLVDSVDPYPADPDNGIDQHWAHCGNEWGVCNVPIPSVVRYGADGQYNFQRVTDTVGCTNHVFGNPINVVKTCSYLLLDTTDYDGDGVVDSIDLFPGDASETTDADGDNLGDNSDPYPTDPSNGPANENWIHCSDEWGACRVPVPASVRYGANGVYFFKRVTDSIACTNNVFGDPIGNVFKRCEYLLGETIDFDQDGLVDSVDPFPRDLNNLSEHWLRCASEGETCKITEESIVRYGVENNYHFQIVSDSVACNAASFNGDPIGGVDKVCDYISLAPTIINTKTQGWFDVGADIGQGGDPSIIFANNIPYIAYSDGERSGKATVKRFNGTVWETVGVEGFSVGSAPSLSISFDNNNMPYVAYADLGVAFKAVVKRFNGTVWETVGVEGFSISNAGDISISFDNNNVPYVVYSDRGHSWKTVVKRFNGSAWESVGGGVVSQDKILSPSIRFDHANVLYIMYGNRLPTQGNAASSNIIVKRFGGTSWETVSDEFFSERGAHPTMGMNSNNVPYVFYSEYSNSSKATVKRFLGSAWELVGENGFSEASSSHKSIRIDSNDVPYVAYINFPRAITIQRFNGTSWETMGERGVSDNDVSNLSISIDSNNAPYVVYQETWNPQRVIAKRFYDGSVNQNAFENHITAIDIDATDINNSALHYSLIDSYDASLFSINEDNGIVTFNAPPNLANPQDSNQDNIYVFEVNVANEQGSITIQKVNVTVLRDDKPSLTTIPPASTSENSVTVEVNGNQVGERVFVNGVDINVVLDADKKATITLDTSGDEGYKNFGINVKLDGVEYFSNTLGVSIYKDESTPELLSGWPAANETIALSHTNQLELSYIFTDHSGISSIKIYDHNGVDISNTATIDSNSIVLSLDSPQDGTYHYTIIATDNHGYKKEVLLTFDVKAYAPVTTASLAGGIYNEAISIDLISGEGTTIYYSTDGYPPIMGAANTQQGNTRIDNIAIASTTNLQFFSVDAAGNTEKTNSIVYRFNEVDDYDTALTATYDEANQQVNLAWDHSPEATTYNIYRVASALDVEVLKNSKIRQYLAPKVYRLNTSATNSFIDTTISNGASYYYAVSQVNANGIETLMSDPVNSVVDPTSPATDIHDARTRVKNWLYRTQHTNGSWSTNESLALLATTSALDALHVYQHENPYTTHKALGYVLGAYADNNDYLSRQILTLSTYGLYANDKVNRLLSQSYFNENVIYGWGLLKRYRMTALDTTLAYKAVKNSVRTLQKSMLVEWELKNSEALLNDQGHWSWLNKEESSVYVSSLVYSVIKADRADYAWIEQSQNLDGSFGNGLLDTLGAVLYLQLSKEQQDQALAYIIAQQNSAGDFNNDVYISALALQALSQGVQ